MHRVKAWAHDSAHASKFNPWSQADASNTPTSNAANANGSSGNAGETETEAPKPKVAASIWKRFIDTLKRILFHSWVNILLVFIPVGIASHFAHLGPGIVFGMNAIAIVPLAGLLAYATESVAHRLGDTIGALMNVSFGNAVELIILIALVKNEIRIVQASLIGSILANLLLILGMAFLIGGLQYREQLYNSTVTQMSACLLCLAVLSLLIPTAFHASFNDQDLADNAVVKLSRGTSVILLLTYVLYLLFQLKSHAYMYESTPQHIIDEESHPGVLARMNSTSSSSSATTVSTVSGHVGRKTKIKRNIRARLGRKRDTEVEIEPETKNVDEIQQISGQNESQWIDEEKGKARKELPSQGPDTESATPTGKRPNTRSAMSFRAPPVFRSSTDPQPKNAPPHQIRRLHSTPTGFHRPGEPATSSTVSEAADAPQLSQTASVILLLASTALVAICAEFLVDSINDLVATSSLSEAFIGLIILPIVGNAAEHVTAVTVAARNKMDLAIGVSVGSSIQIALFVTPLVVIIGWCMDKDMSLYFNLFETVTLFVSTFIVNFLVLDGRSNYLEGSLLCACYIIIAVGAFFFPNAGGQNALVNG